MDGGGALAGEGRRAMVEPNLRAPEEVEIRNREWHRDWVGRTEGKKKEQQQEKEPN
jgi:hypothetical protein